MKGVTSGPSYLICRMQVWKKILEGVVGEIFCSAPLRIFDGIYGIDPRKIVLADILVPSVMCEGYNADIYCNMMMISPPEPYNILLPN